VKFLFRLLVAIVIGSIMFLVCLFIPLVLMSAFRGDPGDIAGGFLTICIGLPVGLVGGIGSGIVAFRKIALSQGSRKVSARTFL
jgi:hypothetical protein